MKELRLKEDDLQDVVVEDNELPEGETCWMAVALVHTDKPYSRYWFYGNIIYACWSPGRLVTSAMSGEKLRSSKWSWNFRRMHPLELGHPMQRLKYAITSELYHMEEIMMRQRSRIDWLSDGDRNTRLFQQCASMRRRKK